MTGSERFSNPSAAETRRYSQNGVNQTSASSVNVPLNKTQTTAEADRSPVQRAPTLTFIKINTGPIHPNWMPDSVDAGLENMVDNNEDIETLTFHTIVTLWMLCTIVLNLRPAFVMLDLIYRNV